MKALLKSSNLPELCLFWGSAGSCCCKDWVLLGPSLRLWSTRGWVQLVLPMRGRPGLGHLEPGLWLLHVVTTCPGATADESFAKNI